MLWPDDAVPQFLLLKTKTPIHHSVREFCAINCDVLRNFEAAEFLAAQVDIQACIDLAYIFILSYDSILCKLAEASRL
jgi:hypothetical protein